MVDKRDLSPISKMFKVGRFSEKTIRKASETITGGEDSSDRTLAGLLKVVAVNQYGLRGKVIKLAYDSVQGLMAAATDAGEIHIFGQQQIDVKLNTDREAQAREMVFVNGRYLTLVDTKDRIITISLESKTFLKSSLLPASVSCIATDPMLTWILLGLEDGTVIPYDVAECTLSNYIVKNWQVIKFFKESKSSKVISLQWNPRDLNTILISYSHVSMTYSLTERKIKQHFIYNIPPFAPGGDYSTNVKIKRTPKVIQSLFHPNSLFILTIHSDNSLVFWDANTGTLIEARTLFDDGINIPVPGLQSKDVIPSLPHIKKATWLCERDSEYTALLIANGPSDTDSNSQSLTLMDFGKTPLYSLNSYESVSNYFINAKRQKLFPILNSSPVKDILPMATSSPFFNGAHDPKVISVLLENGEIETLFYPIGVFASTTSLFPQGLDWVRPISTLVYGVSISEESWLNMTAVAPPSTCVLTGGIPSKKVVPVRKKSSSLLFTGHSNGSVRIWNTMIGVGDNNTVFEVNAADVLNAAHSKSVEMISFSPENLSMAVAIKTGDVVVYKFGDNEYYSVDDGFQDEKLATKFRRFSLNDFTASVVDVSDRAPLQLKFGFMPQIAIKSQKRNVTALCISNIEFLAISYDDSSLIVIDQRNSEVIFDKRLKELNDLKTSNYVTSLNFSIMVCGEDNYSSILLLCGTNTGSIAVFKVLPHKDSFRQDYVKAIQNIVPGGVKKICTLNEITSDSCDATMWVMSKLVQGPMINGYIIALGAKDLCLFRVGKTKKTVKSFDVPIRDAGVCSTRTNNGSTKISVFVLLLTDGSLKILSLPDMKLINTLQHPSSLDGIRDSSILNTGEILVRNGRYHASLLSIFAEDQITKVPSNSDIIFSADASLPNRPQVNSLQWMRGTGYITEKQISDLFAVKLRQFNSGQSPVLLPAVGVFGGGESNTNRGLNRADSTKRYSLTNDILKKSSPSTPKRYSLTNNLFRKASRRMERHWDSVEDKIDDYTTDLGEGLNDMVQDTGKGVVRSSFM
ncbi:Rab GTPase-binding protein SRO7 KNAG_0B02130 [Huiozyma naganishii CBS 8797]|uniref:Lethal giant larvae (Lgl)-like C-terminal domain-containing protein n=1 Tax=Huiozyma naganishii (strain ATCC MYA-139 / BCRC 22969 / CBS 8797 / KCTC 17520 / NBRC 10181 / NCYC 3082 / Yp74L-3) TaxID=1071383 RepID=J7R1G5_HUIN7|nr:hypothetical protein KNAG_0B02130 [Kazachstania naganishii CBS 8797]CCK68655.1 hypothetical protein KNAG_0B02130 [Kazachstania naganishii CBS 8797]